MNDKLDALRQPAVKEKPEKIQKDAQFSFDMPTSTWVKAQGHRKPYPGAPVTIPPVVTTESEVQHRRITPIPVSTPMTPIPTPSEVLQSFREQDARMEQEIQ